MNIISLVFGLTVYGVIKFMILGGAVAGSPPVFGALTATYEFEEIPECNELLLCLNILGTFLLNVFIFFAIIIQFFINILVYIALLITFIGSILIQTIPGAPWYINIIMLTPLTLIGVLLIFKLATKGEADTE